LTMSCVIEIEAAISLATLPPDIIRRIIRIDGDSAPSMRQISHEWNRLAREYLVNLRLPSALERVYLCVGIPEDEYNGRTTRTKYWERMFLHMHSILPERHAKLVGVGGWLRVVKRRSGDLIEVASAPQEITVSGFLNFCSIAGPISLIIVSIVLFTLYPSIISFILTVIMGGSCLVLLALFVGVGMLQRKFRARFTRFFNTFSHIETLVLENFKTERGNSHVFDAVRNSLKGVTINRMEVREHNLNRALQYVLIIIARVSNFSKLSIA
ncbi:hypothetical protein PENTCL1PPCAC_7570, partial [Pristionchus entomophagus]